MPLRPQGHRIRLLGDRPSCCLWLQKRVRPPPRGPLTKALGLPERNIASPRQWCTSAASCAVCRFICSSSNNSSCSSSTNYSPSTGGIYTSRCTTAIHSNRGSRSRSSRLSIVPYLNLLERSFSSATDESSPASAAAAAIESTAGSDGASAINSSAAPGCPPGPSRGPPPPPRLQALLRLQTLVASQMRQHSLPPTEAEADVLMGSIHNTVEVAPDDGYRGPPERAPEDEVGGRSEGESDTRGPQEPARMWGDSGGPPVEGTGGDSAPRRGRDRRERRELLLQWRAAADDIIRLSGRMRPRELLEVLRLLALIPRRDSQVLLAVTQALLQQQPEEPLQPLQHLQQQEGVEALSVLQTVMLLRHLQVLDFVCLPLALRALKHLDDSLSVAAQSCMQVHYLHQQQQQYPQQKVPDCFAETDYATLAPYVPWQQPVECENSGAAVAADSTAAVSHQQGMHWDKPLGGSAARGCSAATDTPSGPLLPGMAAAAAANVAATTKSTGAPHFPDTAADARAPAAGRTAIGAAEAAAAELSWRSALHAVGVSLLSSSLVYFNNAFNQNGARRCDALDRLGVLILNLFINRPNEFNAKQTASLALNCVALGLTPPSLINCLVRRTQELLPYFTFPLLTLQLNVITRLLQINSHLLQQQQQQQKPHHKQPQQRQRILQCQPQQQQLQQQAIDIHALPQLWCNIVSRLSSALPQDAAAAAAAASSSTARSHLRDLLHDHILAAQEAYDASLRQQQQQHGGVEDKNALPSGVSLVAGADGFEAPKGSRSLPPVQPQDLKNVVNALNSFSRLAHMGLVSLRDVSAEAAGAAAVAAAAAAAAADQMVPAAASPQQQLLNSKTSRAGAGEAAAGETDELQRWQRSRARLSSVVECTGGFRMRGVEMAPGDRRSSSRIYGFFHRAILLLVQQQQHLDPQSLSNAVNAFAKARLQGHARYVSQLIPRMIQTAENFSWQHLSMTLNGFGYMRCKDDGLLHAFWQVLRERPLHLMGAQATTNIIHALGSFGFRNAEMTSRLATSSWISAQLPELTTQGLTNILFSLVVLDCVYECSFPPQQQPQKQKGIWQQLLQAACRRKDLKLEAMTMLKVSAMSIFGVYGDPAAAVAAAAAAEVAAAQQHNSSRNAYNRLYDNSGNFLLHALQQQQRQLERERNSLGGAPLAKNYMQLQGKTVPAAIVKQPLDVFLPYEQLDEGHKFLAALLNTRTLMFYPGKPSGMHLQVAATVRSMGFHAVHEVIIDPYVIDILIQSDPPPKQHRPRERRRTRDRQQQQQEQFNSATQ
ncbi:hypothetical protein, conserved [Eimeria necatrix]|uniref:RAP domain-containing protein n=1 Tax=Eimeria necatrix TaxID=51315 RepID=U6MPQ4_9EIME|nr:hypothetical protein, conserved [Eimeria necatrix]CDJ66001.1 hypothetical protein, conserved [Eimeria necatrix]